MNRILQFTILICTLVARPADALIITFLTNGVADGATDNSAAFMSWYRYASNYQFAGGKDHITLYLNNPASPSLSNYLNSQSGASITPFAGLTNVNVDGVSSNLTIISSTSANASLFYGGTGQYQDNAHSARVQTALSGSTSVTLSNSALYSLFTVGQYALITGLDIQSGGNFGFPSNARYFEDVMVTGINSGTGVITFAAPLSNSYEATWPAYNLGNAFQVDQGGPATLYALNPSWNTQVEFDNITIQQAGQTYAIGRSITWSNCATAYNNGNYCPIPTQNAFYYCFNCNWQPAPIEVDKLIGVLIYSNCALEQVQFQSSSVQYAEFDNCQITNGLIGNTINWRLTNCVVTNFGMAPSEYGGDSVSGISSSNYIAGTFNGGFNSGHLISGGFTMTNGIIAYPMSLHTAIPWACPGNLVYFAATDSGMWGCRIKDIYTDGVNAYVSTSLQGITTFGGSWPVFAGDANQANVSLGVGGCKNVLFTNCAGPIFANNQYTNSYSTTNGGRTSYSSVLVTLTTNLQLTSSPNIPGAGQLVSIKANVVKPYTGVQGTLTLNLLAQFGLSVCEPNFIFAFHAFNPAINLKIAGERDIYNNGIVFGGQTGDSGLATPSGYNIWFASSSTGIVGQPFGSADISGESSSVWPIITIEYVFDPTPENWFAIATPAPFAAGHN